MKWVVGQFRLPKLTAPCRYHFPPISQASGPPLSPLHPPEAAARPSPAHKWALRSTEPYFFLQSVWETRGSLACCRISAAGPPPEIRPHPTSEQTLSAYMDTYKSQENENSLWFLDIFSEKARVNLTAKALSFLWWSKTYTSFRHFSSLSLYFGYFVGRNFLNLAILRWTIFTLFTANS